jgi:lauroyl/myristoyl acyltransferase
MIAVVFIVRGLIALIQALPLGWVARLGRLGGALAWVVDRRHRRVALENLAFVFPEKTAAEIRAVAAENLRRIGENYVCALKTAAMGDAELAPRLEWVGAEETLSRHPGALVAAIGHFGNFELYARAARLAPGRRMATTYRALRQPAMNRLLQDLRERSGMRFFERRTDAAALREAMRTERLVLGLLGDQHAGDGGLWLPFFGRHASCSAAPAVYALRFDAPLYVVICYRTGLARWRIEVGEEIPIRTQAGELRPAGEITADINRHYERAIRRDPANWFWVHRRWKPLSPRQRARLEASAAHPDAAEGVEP